MIFGRKKQTPQQFWLWFSDNSKIFFGFDLDNKDAHHLLNQLGKKLSAVSKGVTFEIGPVENNVRDFVISADGILENIPAVKSLVDAAPKLAGWKIVPFRQRMGGECVEYKGEKLYSKDVFFVSEKNPDGKLNITLYIKAWDGSETLGSLSFLLLDDLLGEYDVMTVVGEIGWQSLNDKPESAKPISSLPKVIDDNK